MSFVLRAFANGTDAVFIGGCHLNECHYITDGNHHAISMVHLCKKLLGHSGINPERLRIEELSAGEGTRFTEIMHDFSRKVKEMGPLGTGEGISEAGLKFKLQAAARLVPYIRLVERERLRVRFQTAEEYEAFYVSEEANRLFRELIADKLAISQIMALLREKPRSTGEISQILGLAPSEAAKHLLHSARQGLAKFDERQRRFIAA